MDTAASTRLSTMTTPASPRPQDVLFEDGQRPTLLPVCDHYCGVEDRMRKSLKLQADMGPVFDVTLDNEDGAPVGGEVEHAALIAQLLESADNRWGRVGVRLLSVDHARFRDVAATILKSRRSPAYLMLPKPQSLADVEHAAQVLSSLGAADIPLHTLIETHGALRSVFDIAAHPRIQSLSFGLMDFVSAHRGAIPQTAMGVKGQFEHPLVLRAKLEISAACHAHGKVPSHSVVTEFKNTQALQEAATRAQRELGYTRMWSIHPAQIQPIVDAFMPRAAEVDEAVQIIKAAQAADWAPIRHHDTLHDRASYRYFWQIIERAHRTSHTSGSPLSAEDKQLWFGE